MVGVLDNKVCRDDGGCFFLQRATLFLFFFFKIVYNSKEMPRRFKVHRKCLDNFSGKRVQSKRKICPIVDGMCPFRGYHEKLVNRGRRLQQFNSQLEFLEM